MRLIYCHCRIVTEATKYIQVSRWLRSRSRKYFKFQFENQNHHHYFQNQNHHHFKNKSYHLYSQNQNNFYHHHNVVTQCCKYVDRCWHRPIIIYSNVGRWTPLAAVVWKSYFFYQLKTVFKDISPPCKILRAIWI